MHLSRLIVRGFRASADTEIEVSFPGRFSVMIGANSAGKTTVADALYLGHRNVFPRLPRFSAAGLGSGTRSVDIEYSFEHDPAAEGPLGRDLLDQVGNELPGELAASWSRGLSRSLGTIRAESLESDQMLENCRLVYLPAWRNPLDELARREARILVELLRAQQQRIDGSRNLGSLRGRASGLLESLAKDSAIEALEHRISSHLADLSAGVSQQWSYVRGQVIDDAYLARVLEFMLAALEGRSNAMPLEVSGLGYVNLLHIAVTLTAIPDLSERAIGGEVASSATSDAGNAADLAITPQQAHERLVQSRAEAESEEDSFFPDSLFHATIVIEEPEAHLHPQLQHSLARHLRKVVASRPELQVILSSHATDIITSCRSENIVVLRRRPSGQRVSQSLATVPLVDPATVFRKARLHLDASRSSALFAERLALVEGVTDASLLREFGWVWADGDGLKQSFINALSIVPMGTRVGSWPVQLLATRNHELCERLAILSDSDLDFEEEPVEPPWLAAHDPQIVKVFHSHPTLEPAITLHNEVLVGAALSSVGLTVPNPITPDSIHALFRSSRKAKGSKLAVSAGPGAKHKGEFALELASRVADALEQGQPVFIPAHLSRLFEHLYQDFVAVSRTTI